MKKRVTVRIFNETRHAPLERKIVRSLVARVLRKEHHTLHALNIIITDDKHMKKLNRMFFNKNRPTNVISFAMDELAEIYVSAHHARDTGDMYYYIVHGLLHLIGYDHRNKRDEKIMNNKCLCYTRHVADNTL